MIRPAHKDDARAAVRLIYETIGKIGNNLADTDNPEEAEHILETFFQKPGNRLSYENTIVKIHDGQVVGVLVSYLGGRSAELDRPFIEFAKQKSSSQNKVIPQEADADEFYLDTIAVEREFQGRGYGTQLLQAFEALAKNSQQTKLGLLVEPTNTTALGLYKQMGYVADGEKIIGPYNFLHMVKRLR